MRKKQHIHLFVVLVLIMCLLLSIAHASDNPFEGMRTYNEGKYKVGRDFVAGEYVLLNISEYSGYFAISTDANGRDIIVNNNFETNSIVTVYDGDYLELSRCVAILANDFYQEYTIKTENDGVMLKVGYDILPGEYKLAATDDLYGYYCIYDNSRQVDIIANDNFKNSTWVYVTYGQYLTLSRCHIQE